MAKGIYKILIAGEGGQGVQAMSHILAEAAFSAGLDVNYLPNYGVEQRGGVSLGFLQIGKGVIGFPKFSKADIIVVLRDRAVDRIAEYIDDKTLYIYDSDLIVGSELRGVMAEKLAIPATSLAAAKLSPTVTNMVLVGSLLSEIPVLSRKIIEDTLDKYFADKYKVKPQLRNLNKKALDLGDKAAKDAFKLKR